jgi:hypothetical protein
VASSHRPRGGKRISLEKISAVRPLLEEDECEGCFFGKLWVAPQPRLGGVRHRGSHPLRVHCVAEGLEIMVH